MAYTTWSAVKAYLGITGDGDDALGASLVAQAQAALETHCRRRFEARSEAHRFSVPEGDTLFLDDDLLSISTLTNGDGTDIPETDFMLLPFVTRPAYAIRLSKSCGYGWRPSARGDTEGVIVVTGNWGYSHSPPLDIVLATIRWAAWLYRQRDSAFGQTARPEIGVIETPTAIPSDIERMLRPYVRWMVRSA